MSRPHLLYLTHRVPFPPNRGDRIRTYNILQHLGEWADVSLACFSEEAVADETRIELQALCRNVEIVPIEPRMRWVRAATSFLCGRSITEGAFESPAFQRAIGRLTQRESFDAVLTSSSSFASSLRHPSLRAIPAWVDLIDVDSQKWIDYAAAHRGPKAWLYASEGRRLRALESHLARTTRGLFVVSEAEADLFRSFCAEGTIQAIGNGVDTDYFSPRNETEQADCVFVGALDYLPNIDAAIWFAQRVWPRIHAARPESRFLLVGREPAPAVRALGSLPGVQVVGTVPDVRPYLARSAVVVTPLRIARGVQNKILEAMAMGKAVVSSPRPLQGLPITPGEHCLTADEPHEWVATIQHLLDQPKTRRKLGAAAAAYVRTHHRWSDCLEPLTRSLGSAMTETTLATGPA